MGVEFHFRMVVEFHYRDVFRVFQMYGVPLLSIRSLLLVALACSEKEGDDDKEKINLISHIRFMWIFLS